MDAPTLASAMPGLGLARAKQMVDGCNEALLLGDMTTVRRAAMFLAQVGEESASLRFTEEIASGEEYNGRKDLGNTHPGDGPRFKGRSFIQITGRHNYGSFSQWAAKRGLVDDSDHFVTHPTELANARWAWIGPVWYWTVARNINPAADRADLEAATRAVNGGLHGFQDRLSRYNHCISLGDSILPSGTHSPNTAGETVLLGDEAEEMALSTEAKAEINDIVAAQFSRFFATTGADGKRHDHALVTLVDQVVATQLARFFTGNDGNVHMLETIVGRVIAATKMGAGNDLEVGAVKYA